MPAAAANPPPVLAAEAITKSYGAQRALDRVDFDVSPGEIHALLGENGAGKSTLMKVIAGAVRPDSGGLVMNGGSVRFGDPLAARATGIGIVYQELSLVPTLTAAENVLLGRWPARRGIVDWGSLNKQARAQLERAGLPASVASTPVRVLGMATRQLVEIGKALLGDVRVLLLDEPTSALSRRESVRLFDLIRGLTASGVAVVHVTHRLSEVTELADRVTVLKDGQRVGTYEGADVTEEQLAALMVAGRPEPRASAGPPTRRPEPARSTAEAPALVARGLGRPPRLGPVDLDVHTGEIVGVFGLVGAGRTRLARCLFGLEPATQGTLHVFGRSHAIKSPPQAVAAGLGYVGEDRAMGIVPKLSVVRNITLASLDRVARATVLDFASERSVSHRYIDELDIRVRSPDQRADTLSGGNQQKVVLARWLCSGARLLILDDPTRGIDVGAKEEVFRVVRRLAADGIAVIYLTSEIREAKILSDRLLVMAAGRIVRELDPSVPEETIMAAAGGLNG